MSVATVTQTLRARAQKREAAVHALVAKLAQLESHLETLNNLDDYLTELLNAAVHVDDEGKAALDAVGAKIHFVCRENRNRIHQMLRGSDGSGLEPFRAAYDALVKDTK